MGWRVLCWLLLGSGANAAGAQDALLNGGATAVWLQAADQRLDSQTGLSIDLVFEIPAGPERRDNWVLYIEGATASRAPAAAAVLPELNADAGTALDADGGGRFQVSEFYYEWRLDEDSLLTGLLIDATGHFDLSRLANDENTQFLSAPLVNNPVLPFPDYAPGIVYRRAPRGGGPAWHVALLADRGLADTPQRRYGQLFDVGGRGAFAIAALRFQPPGARLELGAWRRSAERPRLDGSGTVEPRGAYAVAEGLGDSLSCGARAGWATPAVMRATRFLSTYCHWSPTADWRLGLGLAQTWQARAAEPEMDNVRQAELFLRRALSRRLDLSASLQHLANARFSASGPTYDQWAVALRLHYRLPRGSRKELRMLLSELD